MERTENKRRTLDGQLGRGPARGRWGMPPAYVLAACLAAFSSRHAVAQESPKAALAATESVSAAAKSEEINRWVEDLGHDSFTVRQSAASQLLAAGMPARQ